MSQLGAGLRAWIRRVMSAARGTRERQADSGRRMSEEHFRALIENISEVALLIDADGTIRYTSPAIERVLGYSVEERIGRHAFALTHPDDVPRARELWDLLLKDPGGSLTDQRRVQHKDGQWRWVEATAKNLLDEPSLQAIVVTYRDITERRRAVEALRENEARLRILVDNFPGVFWTTDRELVISSSEGAGLAVFGSKPGAAVGRTIYQSSRTDDPEALPIRMHLRALRGESSHYELEFASRNWQSHIEPLRGADGEIVGTIGVTLDVTDTTVRRRAEAALEESQTLFRGLFEAAPDAIVVVDGEGLITHVNARAEQMFGHRREELHGQAVEVLLPAALRERHGRHRAAYAAEPRARLMGAKLELLGRRQDGAEFPVDVMLGPIQTGQGLGVLAIVRDITERKQADAEREAMIHELEAKNIELERFSYTVSHDLKSPLVTISGFLGCLEQDTRDGNLDRLQEDIARIRQATKTMQRLLSELLQLSRIGRLMNPPQSEPFEAIAHEALKLVGGQVTARGVQVDVARDLPVVHGDRARLVELVQNLLDNAAKFMGAQAQPRVEIGVRVDGGERVLYVRDNGIGIEPRHHERVFGLFDKLDPHSEGSGVGLAVVKRIVEVHGGRIWVESEGPGRGTAMCFSLPGAKAIAGHDNR